MALRREDIDDLLKERPAAERAIAVGKVASEVEAQELTEKELQMANSIFTFLAKDVEVEVRKALASALKDSTKISHDLAMTMANDVAEVALPVLEFSEILTTGDLISLVRSRDETEQMAIARRQSVPEMLSDELVSSGRRNVVHTLVGNKGADISDATCAKVVNNYDGDVAIAERLAQRPQLPLQVAERLVSVVSNKLKMALVARHEMNDRLIEDAVLEGRDQAVANLLADEDAPDRDVEALIDQMYEKGRLTNRIVLKALNVEDLEFFEHAIAKRAHVKFKNARLLVSDKGQHGFMALYKQAGLPMEEFDWACERRVDAYRLKTAKTVYVGMGAGSEASDEEVDMVSDDSWLDLS